MIVSAGRRPLPRVILHDPLLDVDFEQHLAIPTNGSEPTIPKRAPRDVSLSAILLPLIPVCPGTHKRRILLRSASLPSASLHFPTSREWVASTASALRAAWLSEQILMCLLSVLGKDFIVLLIMPLQYLPFLTLGCE